MKKVSQYLSGHLEASRSQGTEHQWTSEDHHHLTSGCYHRAREPERREKKPQVGGWKWIMGDRKWWWMDWRWWWVDRRWWRMDRRWWWIVQRWWWPSNDQVCGNDQVLVRGGRSNFQMVCGGRSNVGLIFWCVARPRVPSHTHASQLLKTTAATALEPCFSNPPRSFWDPPHLASPLPPFHRELLGRRARTLIFDLPQFVLSQKPHITWTSTIQNKWTPLRESEIVLSRFGTCPLQAPTLYHLWLAFFK